MCVCDLGGVYIKPTRPWVVAPPPSSIATSQHVAVSLCRCVTLSPCHLVTLSPGRVWSRLVALCGHLVIRSSGHLVIWSSPGHPVILSRLRAFASFAFAPIFCPSLFPLFARSKFILYCASPLVVPIVSILSSPAPILQTRCTFCRDNSLSFYSQRLSWH